ncbi:hypothetical protein HMPREF0294_0573 [Corynebacterium glucuronolyticum ATCC 51867]|nr:hypothetical protein HMPREF0294_0573 [Corynebacterium glucuronolyticum ATCC 51867]
MLKQYARSRGLIPAGAGQIFIESGGNTGGGAHPRRCGADSQHTVPARAIFGSSPQVRGRCKRGGYPRPRPGLIPAGAGQILRAVESDTDARAHPRRCGADKASISRALGRSGSSPQVRGR